MKLEDKYDAIINCKKIAKETGESESDIMVCFAGMLQPRDGREHRIKFIVSKKTHEAFKACEKGY